MKIQQVSVKDIKPYNKNPRVNETAVMQVAESIKQFGFQQPIVVDKKNIIIIGHTRLLAAKELKLKKVPVVVADDLSPKKVKALRIADNKTSEFAEWDKDLLKGELEGLDGLFTGFSEAELDSMFFGFDEVSGVAKHASNNEEEEGVEENEVKLTFIMGADDRDAVTKKLNKIKTKHELETLSDALIKLARGK